ncbi:MAG: ubiquinone biosynthesis protein COQ4 [Parvularculaceae bacterium]|nr:ubiquinone biosynthesis protein COQ4 [Parvularculaceae bacterium]
MDAVAKPKKPLVPDHKIQWVDGFAAPPPMPIRPLHAMVSVIKLILNKEDTRQVFETITAMSGGSGSRLFRRFVATEAGRRVISGEVDMVAVLGDRDALRKLPEGSFGRAYLAFMEEEGLTIEGLMGAAEEADIKFDEETQFPHFAHMFRYLDATHDLWHVVTGYGRDALGELCNLEFTYKMTRNSGLPLIIWMGRLAQKLERPDLPIAKAIAEAERMGRGAAWIMEHDVRDLLPLPLAEVRRRLNITEPTVYNAIPAADRYALLKPKMKTTQTERESGGAGGVAQAA